MGSLLRLKLAEVRQLVESVFLVTQVEVFLTKRLLLLLDLSVHTLNIRFRTCYLIKTNFWLKPIWCLLSRTLVTFLRHKLVVSADGKFVLIWTLSFSDFLNTVVLYLSVVVGHLVDRIKRSLADLV